MNNPKVYIDNCCYNRPFDDLTIEKKTPGFDYTEWRENLWEDITLQELLGRAVQAEEKYGVPKNIEIL